MEHTALFSTPLYMCTLEKLENQNAALRNDILGWKEEHPIGNPRSNRSNSWHSPIDAHSRDAFKLLVEEVLRVSTDVFCNERYKEGTRVRLTEMWANISERGGCNVPHTHSGGLWSGVYFVSVPQGSKPLVLQDPRLQAHIHSPIYQDPYEDRQGTWDRIHHEPKETQLVLFPSWLEHYVEPHEADEPRISISFNLEQIVPHQQSAPTTPVYVSVPEVLSRDDITRVYSQLGGKDWETSRVMVEGGKGESKPGIRNNSVFFAEGTSEDSPWYWLYAKVLHHAEIVNEEVYKVDISGGGQAMQFARYKIGEKYNQHVDVAEGCTDESSRRTLSCSVILRPSEKGGGLSFPRAPEPVPHQMAGDAVFFRADEEHAALAVQEGVRDTLIIWILRKKE